ncbi:hypothetical protein BMW23_0852 [Bodo saltans virus]|uniref:Uncharacterized protein n=1 Tax=Bodo saltans virus TaxID=2024608 RepID=A0A2H4UVE4_9VIRU|nr:hypothetical protein QJ851_gp0835 [Bodo saltans virus]ATZ80898.1 hypothetical protein BMW23_0852 [Bodo saltans virus]
MADLCFCDQVSNPGFSLCERHHQAQKDIDYGFMPLLCAQKHCTRTPKKKSLLCSNCYYNWKNYNCKSQHIQPQQLSLAEFTERVGQMDYLNRLQNMQRLQRLKNLLSFQCHQQMVKQLQQQPTSTRVTFPKLQQPTSTRVTLPNYQPQQSLTNQQQPQQLKWWRHNPYTHKVISHQDNNDNGIQFDGENGFLNDLRLVVDQSLQSAVGKPEHIVGGCGQNCHACRAEVFELAREEAEQKERRKQYE